MKQIVGRQEVKIPDGIKITVKKRIVKVTGPRGTLVMNLRHCILNIEIIKDENGKKKVLVERWFGTKRQLSLIRTVCTHIENMIKGVTKGFMYKMRAVYAHFPINCVTSEGNTLLEIRNFLGEKFIRRVKMMDGVTVVNSTKQKDELLVQGNDLQMVSQSAARIQQSTTVKNKDIRKFLDGLYVSEKTTIEEEEI